jgi:hypothetical protein
MAEYVLAQPDENLLEMQKAEKYSKCISLLTDFLNHIQMIQGVKICKIKEDVQEYDLTPFVEMDSEEINNLVFNYLDINKQMLDRERDFAYRLLIENEKERNFGKI